MGMIVMVWLLLFCMLATAKPKPFIKPNTKYPPPTNDPPGAYVAAPYINAVFTNSTGVDLRICVQNGTRNNTAPLLSGILFEDLAHSGDGGIYGELLRNRAFQGSGVTMDLSHEVTGEVYTQMDNPITPFAPVIDGWYPIGKGVNISLDLLHPLSDALQTSLRIDVPFGATGEAGIENDGWWGIPVIPQTYTASFHVQADGFRWNSTLSALNLSLRNNATGEIFMTQPLALSQKGRPVPYRYTNYTVQLSNTVQAPSTNNSFAITFDAAEMAGQSMYFDLISLFGETYKNRPNGLRKDLAEQVAAGNYKFMRFPGGNDLEGYSIARRYKWFNTVGPLINRPGRPGYWSYWVTDGLGLLEFLTWCEDMELAPLLAVYAGFSLDQANYNDPNSSDTDELIMSLMPPILQEALDELEYCMGSVNTKWGKQRADDGHPDPFNITMVEIGNEDFLSHDYPNRAKFMYEGLKTIYPDITYIFTAIGQYPDMGAKMTLPPGSIWDDHIYGNPSYYINTFDYWDNWQERTKYPGAFGSVLEYHTRNLDPRWPGDTAYNAITHPRMLSAVAEAVLAVGWERNSNVVKLQCFAPLMENVNAHRTQRMVPYLMLFDADPTQHLLSVSYYQQQMFNNHRGTQTLPVTILDGQINPMFWSASIDTNKNEVIFKVVNAGNTSQLLSLSLDVPVKWTNGTILQPPIAGDLNAFNDWNHKTAVVPQTLYDFSGPMDSDVLVEYNTPAYSITVMRFGLQDKDTGKAEASPSAKLAESAKQASAEKHSSTEHAGSTTSEHGTSGRSSAEAEVLSSYRQTRPHLESVSHSTKAAVSEAVQVTQSGPAPSSRTSASAASELNTTTTETTTSTIRRTMTVNGHFVSTGS